MAVPFFMQAISLYIEFSDFSFCNDIAIFKIVDSIEQLHVEGAGTLG